MPTAGEPDVTGLTVRGLADVVALDAIATEDPTALDRAVRSVNVMDLAQPARYLLPSELVLTNGLWFGEVSMDAWVGQLVEGGASALAIGLGDACPVVPPELIGACIAAGLPLFSIRSDVSFTTISEVIAATLAGDASRELRRQLADARSLLRASVDEDAYAALAHHLRRELGFSAAFVSAEGEVLAFAGRKPRTHDIIEATVAFRERRLPASDGPSSAFPVPNAANRGSLLLVGARLPDLTDAERLAIEQATAYAVVADQRRFEQHSVLEALAREMLELIEDGDIGERELRARLTTLGFCHPPVLTVIVGSDSTALRNALGAVEGRVACAVRRGTIEAFLQADATDELVESTASLMRFWGAEPTFGYATSAVTTSDLRIALAGARTAFRRSSDELGAAGPLRATNDTTLVLLTALEPALRRSLADALLGPVVEWDAKHGGDLLDTLQVFFDANGRWRETAAVLGIHVNTLKHRLARIRALSGRDVDRTGDRVDLWIALATQRTREAADDRATI